MAQGYRAGGEQCLFAVKDHLKRAIGDARRHSGRARAVHGVGVFDLNDDAAIESVSVGGEDRQTCLGRPSITRGKTKRLVAWYRTASLDVGVRRGSNRWLTNMPCRELFEDERQSTFIVINRKRCYRHVSHVASLHLNELDESRYIRIQ